MSGQKMGIMMSRMADYDIERLNALPEDSIGERIKKARSAIGLFQEQLAGKIGKVRPTIVQYEAGKILPPIDVIEQLADALSVSPAYLAFGIVSETEGGAKLKHISLPIGVLVDGNIEWEGDIALPSQSVEDFRWQKRSLGAIRLDVGAAHLGLDAGDLLIIETDSLKIRADGKIYAFASPGGVMTMRSEALPIGGDHSLVLTGPNGQTLELTEAPTPIGRVVGRMHAFSDCAPS